MDERTKWILGLLASILAGIIVLMVEKSGDDKKSEPSLKFEKL